MKRFLLVLVPWLGVAPVVMPVGIDLNQHGLTGSWYEPATSGQGVELEVYPDLSAPGTGLAFMSWFTYDSVAGGAERQRWYTAEGPVVTGQPSATLTIYRNTGGNFNAPPITAANPVGIATLSFDSCTTGLLSYSFTDGTGRKGSIPLIRLTQNVSCSTTSARPRNADFAFSGNWYDPATSGQGITVEVNPGSRALFLAWYTYAPNGVGAGPAGQRWYTAQAAFTPGMRSLPLTIYETRGGVFDTSTPPGQETVPVGTGTIAFPSCSAATFSYRFTGGSSAGLAGTINLSRVGPVPPGCATQTACVQVVRPYDDFSGIYIDKAKWLEGESVLEVDAVNQKLRSGMASGSPIGITVYPHVDVNRLNFVTPTSVNSFQADVTIRDSSIAHIASATARLEGVFYNDGTPGAGVIGDVFAMVGIGRETNGALVGEVIIGRLANAEGTAWNILWYQTFSQSVAIGIPYTLYLAFDSVANRFTFRVGGEEKIVGLPDIPVRGAQARAPSRGLNTAVYVEDASSSGYVSATFDNVYKNGIRYDDFSATTIDPARWTNYESVKEISGGRFRSKVRSSSASSSLINELNFADPRNIDGIQARLTLAKYENRSSETAWADAIIGGLFYHDGTPGGGLTGDVMAKVSIGGPGNSPIAFWLVYRFDDETGWNFTDLGYGQFATPISLGTAYALSVGWDGKQFTFKLNDEAATYIPVGTIDPPNRHGKGISTLVYRADGNEATVEALFDDVIVSAVSCPDVSAGPQSIDHGIVSPGGSTSDEAAARKKAGSMGLAKGKTSSATTHRREPRGTF
jgi:hypothetical protein